MIDHQGGELIFECDSCDETFSRPEHDGFNAIWAEAKREGWRAKKIGEDWVHGCPKCGV